MTESGEEIGVLTLPNKIEYEDEQGAQSSEVPNADSPTLEPKHTDCQEDKESVAKKLRKLEKGIEQVILLTTIYLHICYNLSTFHNNLCSIHCS